MVLSLKKSHRNGDHNTMNIHANFPQAPKALLFQTNTTLLLARNRSSLRIRTVESLPNPQLAFPLRGAPLYIHLTSAQNLPTPVFRSHSPIAYSRARSGARDGRCVPKSCIVRDGSRDVDNADDRCASRPDDRPIAGFFFFCTPCPCMWSGVPRVLSPAPRRERERER